MDPGAPYLFLSHTKVDKPRVRALADALQKRGMGAWLDEREMRVGDSIAAEVAARICGSVGVVLCVSPAAFASDWVQRELAFAAMKKVPVFPVELEPVTWPDAAQIYLAEVLRISVAAGEEDAAAASVLEQLRKRGSRVQGILHSNRVKLPAEPSPATLLNAQFEVVPFFEPVRRRELEILETWCSTAAPTSARLFIGPGGAGKTRLMMEWSRRRRDAGWAAGFLSKDASAEDVEAILRTTERTFVVIDYAESRRTSLEVLLKKASRRDAGPPLRIALLARNASDWWASLKAADVAIGTMLAAHLVEALAPVTIAEELRVPVFEHAGKAFGATTIAEVPALDDARFERVLYLHMAALAAVRGWPIDAGELLPDVVTHEIRFWGCDDEAAAARLVAAVTLRGRTAGRDLKTLDERVEGPGERRFRDVVVDLYGRPPEAGGPPEVGGLEPDLLGETIVARTLEERETPEDFLERIFAAADEAALEHAFTVLGRLDLRVREDVTPWLERFLAVDTVARALPAFRAAMTLGETTAESMLGAALARALGETEGAHDVAQAIDREVPEFTVSLRELAAWATARRVDDVVGNKQPEERARLLNNLGNRLDDLGRREDALAATEEAVALRRTLAEARPDAFLPDLAGSLNNLGIRLSNLGRHDEALVCSRESVAITIPFAEQLPRAFARDLRTRADNYAIDLQNTAGSTASDETLQRARALLARIDET
ncbi:MAG: toll/interleukin-1 receptor domain-containing protein [Deltaproteobacteria bacterium]